MIIDNKSCLFTDAVFLINMDYSVSLFPIGELSLRALDATPIKDVSGDDPSRWLCAIQLKDYVMVCNTRRNVRKESKDAER